MAVDGSGWRKVKGVEEKGIEVLVAEEVCTGVTGDGKGKNAEEACKEAVEEGKNVEGARRVGKGVQVETGNGEDVRKAEGVETEDDAEKRKKVKEGKLRSRWAKWLDSEWYGSVVADRLFGRD
jgi:hypothetical protein